MHAVSRLYACSADKRLKYGLARDFCITQDGGHSRMAIVDLQLTEADTKHILRGASLVFKEAPCGRAGDTFVVDGREFEIVDVCERTMGAIARQYSVFGGYKSLPDMIKAWDASHARPCRADSVLFIHWFRPA